jgi:ABC-2 type transport system permease protein
MKPAAVVKNKFRYFDLIRELAITDFKLKYQGSIAGYLWSLAKPLMIFGVLYMVFSVFVRIGSSIPHYPIYLLLGVILWTYFAETTSIGMRAIVDKGDMIRKVYFPRGVLIIAASISAFITLLLNLLIVFLFMIIGGLPFSILSISVFFLLIIELYILSLGVSFFLSSLYVKYRDVGHIWEVLMQVLFYATPIIYPLSIVPLKYQKLILLSPITQILQDSRWILITKETTTSASLLGWPIWLLIVMSPIVIAVSGYHFFNKSAAKFAEDV